MYMEKAPLPCANVPARGKGAYLVLRSGSRFAGSAQSAFHAVICRACGRFTRMVRLWPGRARTHYPTRGMSPARPRGHGRQSVPLLSASALSRSILLRACQFSEFPKLLLLFWALCRLFALFALYLRLDGTICANGGFHPTRQQETMRFVSRGRSSGQTACTNSTYRVLGSCCKASPADPAVLYL